MNASGVTSNVFARYQALASSRRVATGADMIQATTVTAVTDHITGARFATYLALTGGDTRRALSLYRWNIEMSGALQEALSVVEVFLRNAMDAQLRAWNMAQPPRGPLIYNQEWVKDPAGPLFAILNPKARHKSGRFSTYQDAKSRAETSRSARPSSHRRHGYPIDHDDVVAHMSFGIWKKLLPTKDLTHPSGIGDQAQRTLWQDALHKAFPHHPDPTVIKYWVDRLHGLRNRVAHLEPLCDTDVMGYHRTAARLLRAIDPSLADWYAGISRVPEVWRRRPLP